MLIKVKSYNTQLSARILIQFFGSLPYNEIKAHGLKITQTLG